MGGNRPFLKLELQGTQFAAVQPVGAEPKRVAETAVDGFAVRWAHAVVWSGAKEWARLYFAKIALLQIPGARNKKVRII